jgi:hypothetical protein
MDKQKEKHNAIVKSLATMASMVPYFPTDDIPLRVLAHQMERMIETPEQVEWLTEVVCTQMRKWSGWAELRGIYCTRFKPADGGPESYSTMPGFTAEDSEQAYLERQTVETNRKLAEWRQETKMLHGGLEPPTEPITAETSISVPCPVPGCGSQKWVAVAQPGTFENPGGFVFMRCENNHEIDPTLLQELKFAKFSEPVVPGADPATREEIRNLEEELERSKRPLRTPEENERMLEDLKAQLRARGTEV